MHSKELLIRDGKGCRDKGGAIKKKMLQPGAESWFSLKGY